MNRRPMAGSIVAQFLRELHTIGAKVTFGSIPRRNTLVLSIEFGTKIPTNPGPLPENVRVVDFNKKKVINEGPDFTPPNSA